MSKDESAHIYLVEVGFVFKRDDATACPEHIITHFQKKKKRNRKKKKKKKREN